LIDLADYRHGNVNIISTANLVNRGIVEYFALSHCWGDKVSTKLTKANLESMRMFEVSTLPKNFRDAICISQKLGIRYLWIDSLCIAQDDILEWDSESTNMGLVYANAKCVISATASKDAAGGCFLRRDLSNDDCRLLKASQTIYVARSRIKHSELAILFHKKVDSAALTKRAWALQERYLAGRVIHFCEDLILFECNQQMASVHHAQGEEYPLRAYIRYDGKVHSQDDRSQVAKHEEEWIEWKEWLNGEGYVTRRKPNQAYLARKEKIDLLYSQSARLGIRGDFEFLWRFTGTLLKEKIEFHVSWYEIIAQYSVRDLTRSSDKLKALSGMAYFIQRNTGFRYVCGLWLEALPMNLLWIRMGNPESRPTRSTPTWSWAAVDGRISHRLKVVLEQQTDLTRFESTWKQITPLISDYKVQATEEVNELVLNATLMLQGHLHALDSYKLNVIYDTWLLAPRRDMHCLPIISFENRYVHPLNSKIQLHGIVLQKKLDSINQYERVGYFWTANAEVIQEVLRSIDSKSDIRIV
jgi:hypothetical protein